MKVAFLPAARAAARNSPSWPGSCQVAGKKSQLQPRGAAAARPASSRAMERLRHSSSMPWKWLMRCRGCAAHAGTSTAMQEKVQQLV
jgi:hypothetical protein